MRKPKKAMEQALKLVADSPGSANANAALFSTHSGRLPGTLAEEEGASQCDPTVHSRKQQATVGCRPTQCSNGAVLRALRTVAVGIGDGAAQGGCTPRERRQPPTTTPPSGNCRGTAKEAGKVRLFMDEPCSAGEVKSRSSVDGAVQSRPVAVQCQAPPRSHLPCPQCHFLCLIARKGLALAWILN